MAPKKEAMAMGATRLMTARRSVRNSWQILPDHREDGSHGRQSLNVRPVNDRRWLQSDTRPSTRRRVLLCNPSSVSDAITRP